METTGSRDRVPCPGREDGDGVFRCLEKKRWTKLDPKKGNKAIAPHFPGVQVWEGTVCLACRRGRAALGPEYAIMRSLKARKEGALEGLRKDLQSWYLQWSREPQHRGISGAYNVMDLGVEVSESRPLGSENFEGVTNLIEQVHAEGDLAMTPLFDFTQYEGGTWVAARALTPRWQLLLPRSDTKSDTWTTSNNIVKEWHQAIMAIQSVLCEHETLAPLKFSSKHLKWGPPSFLFSVGSEEVRGFLMPEEVFVPQCLHTDHDVKTILEAIQNAKNKGADVPLSIIIAITPNCYIYGCGLSGEQPGEDKFHTPSRILLKNPGDFVVFRGDYIHSGGSYEKNSIRLHLSLEYVKNPENETHLEQLQEPPKWLVDDKGYNAYDVELGEPWTQGFEEAFQAEYSMEVPRKLKKEAKEEKKKKEEEEEKKEKEKKKKEAADEKRELEKKKKEVKKEAKKEKAKKKEEAAEKKEKEKKKKEAADEKRELEKKKKEVKKEKAKKKEEAAEAKREREKKKEEVEEAKKEAKKNKKEEAAKEEEKKEKEEVPKEKKKASEKVTTPNKRMRLGGT